MAGAQQDQDGEAGADGDAQAAVQSDVNPLKTTLFSELPINEKLKVSFPARA